MGETAIEIWNLMAGEIDWGALPLFCELFGVEDPEQLIRALAVIRDTRKQ